jgi:hypothetical protein
MSGKMISCSNELKDKMQEKKNCLNMTRKTPTQHKECPEKNKKGAFVTLPF